MVSLLGVLDSERTLLDADDCDDRFPPVCPGGPALTCLNLYRCCPDPVQGMCKRAHREQAGFDWSHYSLCKWTVSYHGVAIRAERTYLFLLFHTGITAFT